MNLDLIKKHLANNSNREMLNIQNYERWVFFFEKKGTDKKILEFCVENNLELWEKEILFFAGYFNGEYENSEFFSNVNGKTIESHWYEFHKQKNDLIDLIDTLNVTHPGVNVLKVPYIESIIIKTDRPDNYIKIDNHSLCYDIAELLREYLKIPRIYDDLVLEDNFLEERSLPKAILIKPNKKSTSYLKEFVQSTYPFYQFLKSECKLNLETDREYFKIVSQFLISIKLDIFKNIDTLEEDYIKDCYKRLKNKGLNTPQK